jgi:hypothetical protein
VRRGAAATAAATLLVMVDAWFDVLTTPGVQRIESIALAAFVELPLASVCIWLSWYAQQLEERRIVLLMRRYRRRLHRGGRRERGSRRQADSGGIRSSRPPGWATTVSWRTGLITSPSSSHG